LEFSEIALKPSLQKSHGKKLITTRHLKKTHSGLVCIRIAHIKAEFTNTAVITTVPIIRLSQKNAKYFFVRDKIAIVK